MFLATRPKAENSDSDDTLVASEDEDPPLKARATTEDLPSGFTLDQMVHKHKKWKTKRYDDGILSTTSSDHSI